MLKEYVTYLKNNPQGYWFKRKLYGWGWTPARWQGWLIIFVYIAMLVVLSVRISDVSPIHEIIFAFVLPVFLLTIALICICYLTGEKPRWQWGISDEPDMETEETNNRTMTGK